MQNYIYILWFFIVLLVAGISFQERKFFETFSLFSQNQFIDYDFQWCEKEVIREWSNPELEQGYCFGNNYFVAQGSSERVNRLFSDNPRLRLWDNQILRETFWEIILVWSLYRFMIEPENEDLIEEWMEFLLEIEEGSAMLSHTGVILPDRSVAQSILLSICGDEDLCEDNYINEDLENYRFERFNTSIGINRYENENIITDIFFSFPWESISQLNAISEKQIKK